MELKEDCFILNTYARIAGVATVESGTFSPINLDVYLQDATAGINIFKSGSITTIIRGNNYIVEGKIEQFNGKVEIVPDNLSTDVKDGVVTSISPKLSKANGPGILPQPIVMSIAHFLANPETYEGMLVGIQHLSNTNAGEAWPIGRCKLPVLR